MVGLGLGLILGLGLGLVLVVELCILDEGPDPHAMGRRSTFPDMSSSGYSQSDLAGGTMVCMPIGLY